MKRAATVVFAVIMASAALVAHGESLTRFGIISENTGDPMSAPLLDVPDLVPGQTTDVVVVARGLNVRWGEGYAQNSYRIVTPDGQTVYQSAVIPQKQASSGSSWNLQEVYAVDVPGNLSSGRYKIEWSTEDYHSSRAYVGNAYFTVGRSGDGGGTDNATAGKDKQSLPTPVTPATPVEPSLYEAVIEGVRLTLTAVERDSNRLNFVFRALNEGDEEVDLRVYSYTTRIIDGNGEEYMFGEVGGSGNMSTGVSVPVAVPMRLNVYFRGTATKVDHIALLEIAFYYLDDVLRLRNIPVPWSAE